MKTLLALIALSLALTSCSESTKSPADLSALVIDGSSPDAFNASMKSIGETLEAEAPDLADEFVGSVAAISLGAAFGEDDATAAIAKALDGLTVSQVIEKAKK